MPSWLGKFKSKRAKKEKKVKIFDMLQRKLKSSSEEKCNDKSRGSKRYDADTISKKEYESPVPSRSLSPSRLILCCKRFSENPNATSEVRGARGSKPRHVSNSEEPISVSSSVETSSPSSPGSEILIDPLNFKKGKFLGRGSFGQVFLGFNSDSGLMCAMKEVTLCSDDEKSMESAKQLRQEIALLSHLRHPNIIRYYGSETVDDKLYIFLEYAAGGSLHKLLQEYDQLGEDAIRSYTAQILSGLSYLHGKGIVHRDIKGANILMDPNGTVKLADFGTAKHIKGECNQFSTNGSPHWMAPEVIKSPSSCDLSADIWSLGCTILEMATTKPPWSKFEGVAVMYKLGNTDEVPKIPKHLSKEGRDFLRLCLQRDPKSRPSAAELLLHPFVKDIILEKNIMEELDDACLVLKETDIFQRRRWRIGSVSSEILSPRRHRSCPVSPRRSTDLPIRSLDVNRSLSSSPMWSLDIAFASSSLSLRTSGTGAASFYQTKHAIQSSYMASGSSSLSPRISGAGAIGFPRPNQQILFPHIASGSSSPLTFGSTGAIPLNQISEPTFSRENVSIRMATTSSSIYCPSNAPACSSSQSPGTGDSTFGCDSKETK
ncbi:unnamed protein product [Lupinus luteus]|uniref:mitogen-activated protein kinase kinase kinase n=1 Tax=Lupinus luteus TaxID=3873 RepID=A0AAV1YDS5_LUPLU